MFIARAFGRTNAALLMLVVGTAAATIPVNAQAPADSAAIYLARARFAIDSGTTAQRAASLALFLRAGSLFRSANDTLHEAEALVGAGAAWRVRTQYDSVRAFTLRARALYRAIGEKRREAETLLLLDWNVANNALTPDSVRFYQRAAIDLWRELRHPPGEVRALIAIGASFRTSVPDSALKYHHLAMSLARSARDTTGELLALNRIGGVYMTLDSARGTRHRDSAATYFRAGVRLARLAGNAREECADLGNLVSVYQGLSGVRARNADSAFAYAVAFLDATRRLSSPFCDEVSAYYRYADMQSRFGFADSARLYAHRGLAIGRTRAESSTWTGLLTTLLARLELQMGWPDSALVRYREAEQIAAASGIPSRMPAAWTNLANAHAQRGSTDSALYYYRRVAFPGTTAEVGAADLRPSALWSLGDFFLVRGRPDSAAKYFDLLSRFATTTAPNYRDALDIGMGRVALETGALDSAKARFARAVTSASRSSVPGAVAAPLSWLSTIELRSGQVDSSLAKKRRSLELFRQADNRDGEATQLSGIGAVYSTIGFPDSALFYHRASLAVNLRMAARANIRNNYQSIGSVFLNTDVQDSAVIYFRRALTIANEMDSPIASASALQSIGVSFASLGQLDSARVYYERALDLYGRFGLPVAAAATMANLAHLRMRDGVDDSTFALLRRALALRVETQNVGGEGIISQYLSRAFVLTRQLDSGEIYARRALDISRRVQDRVFEGRALAAMGAVFARSGATDSARAYFGQAIASMRSAGFARGLRVTLAEMAELFRSGGGRADLSRATAYFDSAAAVVDDARRGAGGDDNAVSLAEEQVDIFGGWARAWIGRRGEVGDSQSTLAALGAIERGRAQALVDMLDRTRSVTPRGVERARIGANLAGEANVVLEPLRSSRSAALSYLHAGDTLFVWFVSPAGEARLLPPRYIPADELARLIRSARASFGADDARSAELDPDELGNEKRDSAGKRDSVSKADEDLRKLAELLLPGDLDRRAASGAPIVIVPHGAIALVPFAALEVGRRDGARSTRQPSSPLGARHPLRFAPSFAALRATERAPSVLAPTPTRSTTPQRWAATGAAPKSAAVSKSSSRATQLASALVVGNPTMPYVYSGRWTTRSQLRPLPGAEAESRSIARTLGARVLTGRAATETAIRARLSSAPLVHFATHGLAYGTAGAARRSFIAFAPDSTSDGLLTLGELMDDPSLTLRADLVVLSACQTGLGDLKKAEGTVGLQRAFLAKGARSVLVSLWNVDDKATRLLMEKFYGFWLDSSQVRSKADALRLAQAAVRARPEYAHPKYWAAFQLVGAE